MRPQTNVIIAMSALASSSLLFYLRGTASMAVAVFTGLVLAGFDSMRSDRELPVVLVTTLPWCLVSLAIFVSIVLDKRFLEREGEAYDSKGVVVSVLRSLIFMWFGWFIGVVAGLIAYHAIFAPYEAAYYD